MTQNIDETMVKDDPYKNVRLRESTLERIKTFAEEYGDTYDIIANRLMDFKEKHEKRK